jgi:hypothetical protein
MSARKVAAAAMMVGLLAASSAGAQPAAPVRDATVSFHGGHVALVGALQWGRGTLHYRGARIPIRVNGVGVGAIGVNSFSVQGDVFNLRHPRDIEGVYTAIAASATAGGGAGVLDMTNQKGVEIKARSTSAGLSLSLAPTGMTIRLR